MSLSEEIRVCMDIGSHRHSVVVGLSNGEILESFEMSHTAEEIRGFFDKLSQYEKTYQLPISVAMEAYNGHARPIDQYTLNKGYRLFNVNNYKLSQFKRIFPGPAKTDAIDSQKMFELFHLQSHLPMAKNVLQEVVKSPEINQKLKRITRRRNALVDEKKRTLSRMQSDIKSVSPGLINITNSADNLWFLRFMSSRDDLRKLSRLQEKSLYAIAGVGKRYHSAIEKWQKKASFSEEVEWVGDMIIRDAKRILELKEEIKRLEKIIEELLPTSDIAYRIKSIVGFGDVSSAILAGEIGTLSRFKSESSLALYLGMAVLDNSSGEYSGTKRFQHVNRNAKQALMIAIARHVNHCSESKMYYDKKRLEGKRHNQAIRAIGRHLVRVIWSMIKNKRYYEIRNKSLLEIS